MYPNLCDDIGPRHPRLASEVQIENIIEEKLRRLGKSKSKNRRLRHLHKNSRRLHKGKNSKNSRRLKK